ncbi:uncharacterized protein CDAR_273911 [Caerostris darwini]|uniref:Gustatory receptor n=1 Tax=Caerostris darwini TaxID=1538125 RepID=A0AAV4RGW8_9ARAC|nr:uncharacterized protein CDAR_273911 [Caerostris darwini]
MMHVDSFPATHFWLPLKSHFYCPGKKVFFRATATDPAMWSHGYGQLWNILASFGIQTDDGQKKANSKTAFSSCLKSPVFLLYVLSAFYSVPMLITAIASESLELRTLFPILATCSLSCVLWYVLFQRRRTLKEVAKKLGAHSRNTHLAPFNRSRLLNSITAAFLSVTLGYLVTVVYYLQTSRESVDNVWNFGYEMSYNFWGLCVRFLQVSCYNLQVLVFPGLASFHMSAMYLSCADSLLSYRRKLEVICKKEISLPCVMEYSKLVDLVREFGDVLSAPASVVLVLHLLLMFNSLASFFLLSEAALMPTFMLENLTCLFCSAWCLLLIAASASEVHVRAGALSTVLGELHEREVVLSRRPSRRVALVKAMADKEAPLMSACDVVYFRRRYILSVLGGFFTYALLFINIKS